MRVQWCRARPCSPVHSLQSSVRRARLRSALVVQNSPCLPPRRTLLTLAIESSCDDTCVALLHKARSGAANLLFNKKITSDNRDFRGVHPLTAVVSHTAHLAPLIQEALRKLPEASSVEHGRQEDWKKLLWVDGQVRRKPDFVTVTRGPGMTSNLATGMNTAKGLAAAWDVPLLGVNHMQAHALTPRLVSALEKGKQEKEGPNVESVESGRQLDLDPPFAFLSLLVSGGHTLLVHSRTLTEHPILASAMNIAIGDMIDKCARCIIPPSHISAGENVMYGPLLEKFAFPHVISPADYGYTPPQRRGDEIEVYDSGLGWTLTPPLAGTTAMAYDFAGFNGQVQRVVEDRPSLSVDERRLLAKHAMRLAFEHLASRLLLVLKNNSAYEDVKTVVVAGGVASNRYLMHILKSVLEVRGFGHLEVVVPPSALCTDNAAMIAWTGMEMYEAGWRSQMDILAIRKWPIDPKAEGGGILGADGWVNVNK
ncbi:glycoprotease family protein-like protein [Xylariales sp. AK1849]|nr:glycoprotease family protein-like protein [Xylariales sp. AK1849]